MNQKLRKTLLWLPRILGIGYVLFISLFALDIFDADLGFWGTLLGLFMHLIPSIILAIAIAIAWRWEIVGAVLFMGWAVFYLANFRGFDWIVYVLIAGIPFVIGILYLAGWIWRKQIRG